MTMKGIVRMFGHMEWADRRLLGVMGEESGAMFPDAAIRLFAHVLAAERVWLMRLRGEESGAQVIWPEVGTGGRAGLAGVAAENHEGYGQLTRDIDQAGLARVVSYTNQRGAAYRTSVEDILIHVAMHGAYHRGQIAARVRESGGEPVNTDYITYVREGGGRSG